jgi:uncharacterized repeat protein (TIGR03803 family)
MERIVKALGKFGGWKRAGSVVALGVATAMALPAQTLTTLVNFGYYPAGSTPMAPMVQGSDGYLYGTAYAGGNGGGTVFKMTPAGALTTLYRFCSAGSPCSDGTRPGALALAASGEFYGTTEFGGGSGNGGTIFKITVDGPLTTLYSFCSQSGCPDGDQPNAALVQAASGDFYGTTWGGGATNSGTVFRITESGRLTTLYNFCARRECMDGKNPAGLVLAKDGNFYGTTANAAPTSGGTIFRVTPGGTLTTLYTFCPDGCTDGQGPNWLVQAADGDLYGTTVGGGAGDGTVFKITLSGTLTTLYSFCTQNGCKDGEGPNGIIQAADGNFYGTTYVGGSDSNYGTIFRIAPSGTLTTLRVFHGGDGAMPAAGLVQATNGEFYGTTEFGGTSSACKLAVTCGTVFSLAVR